MKETGTKESSTARVSTQIARASSSKEYGGTESAKALGLKPLTQALSTSIELLVLIAGFSSILLNLTSLRLS